MTGEPLMAGRGYVLRPEAGLAPALQADDPLFDAASLIGLQAALDHGSVAALQQACLPVLPALKGQMRQLLHYHLGSPRLRTRQLMMDLQNLER